MATNNNQNVLNYMMAVEKYLEGFKNVKAVSGILDTANQKVKDKAKWNEYGTRHKTKHSYSFLKNDIQVNIPQGADISIPARPFIRINLYEETGEKIKESMEQDLRVLLQFHSRLANNPTQATFRTMQNMGNKAMVLQRQKASSGGFEPSVNRTNKDQETNAPLTVLLKGFNYPLFETGEMISSISSEVVRRV